MHRVLHKRSLDGHKTVRRPNSRDLRGLRPSVGSEALRGRKAQHRSIARGENLEGDC